jgi:hypothetical protein
MARRSLSLAAVSFAAIAGVASLMGAARQAAAAATITLEWGACGGGAGGCAGVGTNTLSVFLPGGQTLRLDIFLQHDEVTGLNAHTFSLNFDTDGLNELNIGPMATVEWLGTDTHPGLLTEIYGPFTAGVDGSVESGTVSPTGRMNSFESGTVLSTGLPATGVAYTVGTFTATAPARYRVAQAFFTVALNAAWTDGADVFSGSFNGLFDISSNGLNQIVTMNFGTASLNEIIDPAIPEPGPVALLGLGLVGLVLARRRSRRA